MCSKVISNSPEGLQQSVDVIYKHAQEWKFKVNTKKSYNIVFSGNGHLVVKPTPGKFFVNSLHNLTILPSYSDPLTVHLVSQ